ncbi:hypothetical protein DKC15_019125 (plasmid) [Acinetobacter pittii]|nr:hypothetical protein DKC15_019125 [Acinetobacter pittii]
MKHPRSPSGEDKGGATKGKKWKRSAPFFKASQRLTLKWGLAHPRRNAVHDHPLTVKKSVEFIA